MTEMRVVAAAISRIRRTSEELLPVEFTVRELSQMLNLHTDAAYSDIKEMAPRLAAQIIHIHDPELGRHDWVSLCDMSYFEGDGRLVISFNPRLRPHLLRLKEKFTTYGLKQILSLTSPYQIRLYEWLKSWQYLGKPKRELITALRRIVGAEAGSYANFFTFHGRILKPSILAINKHTDLKVTYDIERKNRIANSVTFTIRARNAQQQPELPPPPQGDPDEESEPTLFGDDVPSKFYDSASTAAQAFVSYWNQRMTQSPFGIHSPTARSEKIAQLMRADQLFLGRWKDLVDVVAESPVWNGRGLSGTGKAFHANPKWFLAHLPEIADELAAKDAKDAKKRQRRVKAPPAEPEAARPVLDHERVKGMFTATKRELGAKQEPASASSPAA